MGVVFSLGKPVMTFWLIGRDNVVSTWN